MKVANTFGDSPTIHRTSGVLEARLTQDNNRCPDRAAKYSRHAVYMSRISYLFDPVSWEEESSTFDASLIWKCFVPSSFKSSHLVNKPPLVFRRNVLNMMASSSFQTKLQAQATKAFSVHRFNL